MQVTVSSTGKGGQAIIRDEPNAMGISTKKLPNNNSEAFMSDAELASNKATINDDIYKAKQRAAKEGKTIVLPKGGFGTGLAALATKAPLTFAYLNKRLQEEFGFNNTTGELAALTQPTTAPKVKPEDLKINVSSTINGLVDIEKQDSDISTLDEFTFMKKTGYPGKLNGFVVEDGILRVRIGGTDFMGRSGGATYISMKVPDNFNETLFSEKLNKISHENFQTTKTSVPKVVSDVKNAVSESTAETITSPPAAPTSQVSTEGPIEEKVQRKISLNDVLSLVNERVFEQKVETETYVTDQIKNL